MRRLMIISDWLRIRLELNDGIAIDRSCNGICGISENRQKETRLIYSF